MLDKIKGGLIVSCQALPHEPLHSSFIMGRMALAAKEGGAIGIRANTAPDIAQIKKNVDLPIIGIVKRDYPHCPVYITPTESEVDQLVEVGAHIIAMDATSSPRPGGESLGDFFRRMKQRYPHQLWMADCSTLQEAVEADKLGFDLIGTTLVGYTEQSKGHLIKADDFAIIRAILEQVSHPVVAEGNMGTPQKAKRVLELGCHSVVVGAAITRPQLITKSFVDYMQS